MKGSSDSDEIIYVLKDGARLGPYTVDDLLDLIDEGALNYDDVCLRDGELQCVRDLGHGRDLAEARAKRNRFHANGCRHAKA